MAGEAAEGDKGSTIARIAAAAALVLAIVLAAFLLVGGSPSYEVTARFLSAGQLVKGNLVQVVGPAGRHGQVDRARRRRPRRARARDRRRASRRCARGTQATLRMASLSGVANRYVDLQHAARRASRGDPRRRRDPGRRTRRRRSTSTSSSTLFDDETRKGLRNVVRGFGASYEDQRRGGQRRLGVPQPVARRRRAGCSRELTDDARVARALPRRRTRSWSPTSPTAATTSRCSSTSSPTRPARSPRGADLADARDRRAAAVHAPREHDVREPARDARRPRPAGRGVQAGHAQAARRARRAAPVRPRRDADGPRPRRRSSRRAARTTT